MEKVIGILEEEGEYPKRLAEYVNNRRDIGCVAIAFQTGKEVLQFGIHTPFFCLVIGLQKEETEDFSSVLVPGGVIYQLVEEPVQGKTLLPSGRRGLFRYQRAGELLCRLLEEETAVVTPAEGGLYTVYSPGAVFFAERFAWQYAKKLSGYGKTLFLSWEPFGGFGREWRETEQNSGSISDLLYLLRSEAFTKTDRLLELPQREGVFYVPGASYCTDLWQYTAEELLKFLSLCKQAGFSSIVFLAGYFSEGIEALMEKSEELYLVTEEGEEAKSRCREFFRQMKYAGKQSLLSRVKEVEWKGEEWLFDGKER